MKVKAIPTIPVFSKGNQVFIKKMPHFSSPKKSLKTSGKWRLINFKWVPIVILQDKFKV